MMWPAHSDLGAPVRERGGTTENYGEGFRSFPFALIVEHVGPPTSADSLMGLARRHAENCGTCTSEGLCSIGRVIVGAMAEAVR